MQTESITVYFEPLNTVAGLTFHHETVVYTNSEGVQFLATAYHAGDDPTGSAISNLEQASAAISQAQQALNAGTVQALSVTNRGQVVTTGQEVMRLVPTDGPLEIEAYVANDDIGFVAPGQVAAVKVDSFPFARFGMLDAEVSEIAYDAIPADSADQTIGDATRRADLTGRRLTPTAKPMTDLVFETKLRPKSLAMNVNGRDVPLSAGMTVTVEIKTGARRIIGYLVSPLFEIGSNAMRER